MRIAILMAVAAGLLGLALLVNGLVAGLPLIQPSSSASQSPGLTHGPLATPTVTATPTITPTPTPPPNWLAVSPASIHVDCAKRTSSVKVVLRNNGPELVSWRANVPFLGGVSVNPSNGTLRRGGSATITITNTSNFISHQDTITFEPAKDEAGAPASVAYSTEACLP